MVCALLAPPPSPPIAVADSFSSPSRKCLAGVAGRVFFTDRFR
jgi:hypothetical protein